ncbi:MAG: DUF2470 domain-containing protein [Bacteroidota bacterium]
MDAMFDQKFMQYAVNHVNEDHKDAMLHIFKSVYTTKWVVEVTLLFYNANEMFVEVSDGSNMQEQFSISFPTPLKNAKDFRPVLIAMLNEARKS